MGYRATDKCLRKVEPGEPIFVLRGQDMLAPALVRHWANLAALIGTPREKCEEALELAEKMDQWPASKVPD